MKFENLLTIITLIDDKLGQKTFENITHTAR